MPKRITPGKVYGSLVQLKDWDRAMMLYQSGDMDGLELRLDAFNNRDLIRLRNRLSSATYLPPLIITVRSHKEGGLTVLKDLERKKRYKLFLPFADFVDCELHSHELLVWLRKETKQRSQKLIISYHNFVNPTALYKLRHLFLRMRDYRPDVYKMAFHTPNQNALLPLIRFLKENRNNSLILIGMGKAGTNSRVLLPALGSLITYGSLSTQSAPGQLPVVTLKRQLNRLTRYRF